MVVGAGPCARSHPIGARPDNQESPYLMGNGGCQGNHRGLPVQCRRLKEPPEGGEEVNWVSGRRLA